MGEARKKRNVSLSLLASSNAAGSIASQGTMTGGDVAKISEIAARLGWTCTLSRLKDQEQVERAALDARDSTRAAVPRDQFRTVGLYRSEQDALMAGPPEGLLLADIGSPGARDDIKKSRGRPLFYKPMGLECAWLVRAMTTRGLSARSAEEAIAIAMASGGGGKSVSRSHIRQYAGEAEQASLLVVEQSATHFLKEWWVRRFRVQQPAQKPDVRRVLDEIQRGVPSAPVRPKQRRARG